MTVLKNHKDTFTSLLFDGANQVMDGFYRFFFQVITEELRVGDNKRHHHQRTGLFRLTLFTVPNQR